MKRIYILIFIFVSLVVKAQEFNHGGIPVKEGVSLITKTIKNDIRIEQESNSNVISTKLPPDGDTDEGNDPIDPLSEPTDPSIIINSTGVTKGELSVSLTGGASYNIPIAIPPGINGTVPQISLAYNSQSGNGLAGWGWNISGISTISRIPSTKFHDDTIDAIDFDSYDRFSFDGQRLILKSGIYGSDGAIYETENYKNIKITSVGVSSYGNNYGPDYFIVEYPDGSKAYYGKNLNTKNELNWSITYWENPLGVRISYEYIQSGNSLFISKIKYGSLSINAPINEVQFIYINRTRNEQAYVGGKSFLTSKILDQIKVISNEVGYRNYYLSYNTTSLGYERLTNITEKSGDDSKSLKPTVFSYDDTNEIINFNAVSTTISANYVRSNNTKSISGDFNGDGNMDFILYPTTGSNAYREYSIFNDLESGSNNIGYNHNIGKFDEIFPVSWLGGTANELKLMPQQAWVVIQPNLITSDVSFKMFSLGITTPIYGQDVFQHTFPKYTYSYISDCGNLNNNSNNNQNNINKLPDPNDNSDDDSNEVTIERIIPKRYVNGDFNGDGISDIIAIEKSFDYYYQTGCSGNTATYNGGRLFMIKLDRRLTNNFVSSAGYINYTNDSKIIVSDFNGDGKSDLFVFDNSVCRIYTLNNDDTGFILLTSISDSYIKTDKPILMGDYNGDGKSDFIIPKENNSNLFKKFTSTGISIQATAEYDLGIGAYITPIIKNNGNKTLIQHIIPNDFNNDGKTDLILTKCVYINTRNKSEGFISVRYLHNKGSYFQSIIYDYIEDLNGISTFPLPVYLGFNKPNANKQISFISNNNIYTAISNKDHTKDIILREVKLGNGVKETITYTSLKEEFDDVNIPNSNTIFTPSSYTENYPNFDIKVASSFNVVSKIEMQSSTDYKKQDYKYYGAVSNVEGLGFLGFRALVKSNWYNDSYPVISNISKYDISRRGILTENFSVMGTYLINSNMSNSSPTNFISKSTLNYENELLPNKVYKIKNTSSEVFNGLENSSKQAITTFDSYNNPIQNITKYKLGTNIQKTETTTIQYQNLTSGNSYIIGRPIQKNTETVYGSSTMTTEEIYSYNSSHLLNQVKRKGTGTNYLTENNVYDSFGNITEKTITAVGLPPRVTHYEYDVSGRFLTKSIDIEGLETVYTYNPNTGQLLTETNPYDLTTTYSYDVWFRKRKVTDYLGKSKSYLFENTPNNLVRVTTFNDDDSQSFVLFDDLGREIINGFKNLNDKWNTTSTIYDIYNRKISVSEPYLTNTIINSNLGTQFNTTTYDSFGRLNQTTSYTGKVTNVNYNGVAVTVNDGFKTVTTIKDATGNIISHTDDGGTINYQYFANNNLKQSSYNGNIVTILQDGWGRKIQMIDPSAGTYSYSYNDFGELLSEITPKGTTTYTLNPATGKLNQKEIIGDNTHLTSYYTYNTDKLLTNITTNTGANYSYEYDNYKRLWRTSESLPDAFYQTATFFDEFGRAKNELQTAIHIASGKHSSKWIEKKYKNGVLNSIVDNTNNIVLWKANQVNEREQLTQTELGNGITITNTYDNYGFLATTNHTNNNTTGTSTVVMNLNTTFEPLRGNLTSRYNSLFNWNETFSYDTLDRLVEYTDAGGNQVQQIYEQDGRIKQNNLGTYNYANSAKKYQNTSINVTPESLSYYNNKYGIFNDSMESQNGWTIYEPTVVTFDSSVSNSGNVSLKIANTTTGEKVVHSDYWINIDNAQPTEYTYSVKVKSDGTNPDAEIFLFMKSATETGYFTLVDQKISATTTEWVEIEKTFLVPANIKKLNIRLDNNGTGNLWFDDVKIRKSNQLEPTQKELNITYNAFKSPVEIHELGVDRINFDYNVFQSRSTMYYGNEEADKLQRRYRKHYSGIGSMEIKYDTQTGEVEFITYLGGDAYNAPVVLKSNGTTQEYLYLHKDYLGSIVAITNQAGNVVEKRLFDAWGEVIKIQDGNNNLLTSFAVLDRGYTGHEHLQSVALVHMNGRLYDAKLHRFLQPDNFVQDPYNTQNYNRYGYVLNNPLKYTDPSGESFKEWWSKNWKTVVTVVAAVATAAVIVLTAGTATPIVTAMWAGAGAGFVGGSLGTALNGGDVTNVLVNGLIGAGTGAIFGAIGGYVAGFAPAGIFNGALFGGSTNAVLGGLSSLVTGGDWKQGVMLGAALGTIGGGFGGYAAAKNQGANIWTGKPVTPKPSITQVIDDSFQEAFNEYAKKSGEISFKPIAEPTSIVKTAPFTDLPEFSPNLFDETSLTNYYPPNDGAVLGTFKTKILYEGTIFDRYGTVGLKSNYVSPADTPLNLRFLPSNNDGVYNLYRVVKPFPVQSSQIAPLGLGTQWQTPVPLQVLQKRGIITRVK